MATSLVNAPPLDKSLGTGLRSRESKFDDTGMRVLAELPPGASQVFSVMYRNDYAALGRPGFMWDARAFLRRRLSELRDNHLSKNQHVLTAARAVQRRFLK